MSETPAGFELEDQLRCDITVLRTLLDTALERTGDGALIEVCATMLRDRREQLEVLEAERMPGPPWAA